MRQRRILNAVARFLAYGLTAAAIAGPVAAAWSIEHVRFSDRLGSLPVEVTLSHNGVSTLDTGILGKVYWARTGAGGFGAHIRATDPPQAGGSLASYVDPRFVQANAQLIGNPGAVATAYGTELRDELLRTFGKAELGIALLVGTALSLALRERSLREVAQPAVGLGIAGGLLLSQLAASIALATWEGSEPISESYRLPEVAGLSFSSPEVLEVARQVRPFLEKNAHRIEADAARYEAAAAASLRQEFSEHVDDLTPREGEVIVLAESDPQGSRVATRVRQNLYRTLASELGARALALRTISGDISSNGAVGERGFVEREAHASPGVTTVIAKGDHDTAVTVKQLEDNGVVVPDGEMVGVRGLRVTAGNDPAFKTLMGGMVVNKTGVSEHELGARLRAETSGRGRNQPRIVLLHQPKSAAGYLGLSDITDLGRSGRALTEPRDDGIPDLPPGILNYGHWHEARSPWVIWNTDGGRITWTVVNQLGTSGGVDEAPTFNRFSTPYSPPLKDISVQLQFVRADTGLQTGYASIVFAVDGAVSISTRTDLGLPGGEPYECPTDDEATAVVEGPPLSWCARQLPQREPQQAP